MNGTIKVCQQTLVSFCSSTLTQVLCSAIIVTAFAFAVSRSQWRWRGQWVMTLAEH